MPFMEDSSSKVVPLWINGKAQPLNKERFIPVISSVQNKTIHHAQGASPDDARAACDAALAAFPGWRATNYERRRRLLLKVAEIYERRIEEIIKYQVEETSCPEPFARFNVIHSCMQIREFASAITEAMRGEIQPPQQPDGTYCFAFKESVGPILIIPPWNASILLSTRGISAAIAAGCSVVMKASELCPRTHHAVVEAFEEAGLPVGVLNQVQAARDDAPAVTEALIAHPAIRKVEFIGSAAVGRIVGSVAAKHLKPVLMELGGKGPAIVLKDANLQNAAKLCAAGALFHHGQVCFSTERIIVERPVFEEFTKLLVEEIKTTYPNGVGFAATKRFADHAHEVVEEAKRNGAKVLVGDNSFIGDTGVSLTPTILTGIKPTDRIRDEETFGPSSTVYVVEDADEALKLANDSSYGLNASIHSRDVLRALDMARKMEWAQVHINGTTTYDEPTFPVSGFKGSGWGTNNSKYGIHEFMVTRVVTVRSPDTVVTFGRS